MAGELGRMDGVGVGGDARGGCVLPRHRSGFTPPAAAKDFRDFSNGATLRLVVWW